MVRVVPLQLRLPVPRRLARFTSVSYEQGTGQQPIHPEAYHHLLFPHLYMPELPPDQTAGYRQTLLRQWETAGFFEDGPGPRMFLYRQVHADFTSEGWIAGVDVEDYRRGCVKKHENILPERARQIAEYFGQVHLNGSPILLMHRRVEEAAALREAVTQRSPTFSFTDEQDTTHAGWMLTAEEAQHLAMLFSAVSALYIGDGHHRCRAYDVYYRRRGGSGPMMAFIAAEDQVRVSSFHRLLSPMRSIEKSAAEAFFSLEFGEPVAEYAALEEALVHSGEVGLYTGRSVTVYALPDRQTPEVAQVDPVLDELRKGTRIGLDYVNSRLPAEQLRQLVDDRSGVLVLLPPLPLRTIFRYADQGATLPPKATWLEPKMRSGLFLHRMG